MLQVEWGGCKPFISHSNVWQHISSGNPWYQMTEPMTVLMHHIHNRNGY